MYAIGHPRVDGPAQVRVAAGPGQEEQPRPYELAREEGKAEVVALLEQADVPEAESTKHAAF